MDINTIEKEIEEFKKQKEENNKKIILFDERMKIAYLSSAKYSREITMFFGAIGYFLLFSIFFGLNIAGINLIQTNLSVICFPLLITSSSLIIGTIAKKIFFKKKRYNDKLKRFSNAKTETEKREEEISNTIKRNKLIVKNDIFDLVINKLEHKQDVLKEVSKQYNLTNKQDVQNKEEIQKKIITLSNDIINKYKKLDILIHQNNIYGIFLHLNYTLDKVFKLFYIPFGIGIFSGFFSLFTSLFTANFYKILISKFILGSQVNLILWFLIGFSSSLTLNLIQYKTDKKVLNNIINNSNDIHIIKKQKEMDEVNDLIKTYINDIASSLISLKELKYIYDNNDSNPNDSKTKDRTISPISDDHPYEEAKKLCRVRKRTINSN